MEESATNNKFDEESITNEDAVKKDEAARSAMSTRFRRDSPFIQKGQSGESTETASVQPIRSDAETVECKNMSVVV